MCKSNQDISIEHWLRHDVLKTEMRAVKRQLLNLQDEVKQQQQIINTLFGVWFFMMLLLAFLVVS